MIFASEIRAGRALLGWSQTALAEAASVGVATVRRLEGADSVIRGSAETIWKIQTALEAAGVEFIPSDEVRGPGVRLKKKACGQKRPSGKREK
jgi:transcriptional regulator with XRE-family HTH domain